MARRGDRYTMSKIKHDQADGAVGRVLDALVGGRVGISAHRGRAGHNHVETWTVARPLLPEPLQDAVNGDRVFFER